MKFESLNAVAIVGLDEESNTETMHPKRLGEGQTLPDQTTDALTQCQVKPLCRIGPTTALRTRNMLVFWNDLTIGLVKVREH